MKVGFSTGALYEWGLPFNERIKFFHDLGVDSIELAYLFGFEGSRLNEESLDLLSSFDYVSIHAPVAYPPKKLVDYGGDEGYEQILKELNSLIDVTGAKLVGFHPNTISDFSVFEGMHCDVAIENMDGKFYGSKIEDLDEIFSKTNYWLLYDVLHAFVIDSSLELGRKIIKSFGNRIKEVHVSGGTPRYRHTPLVTTEQKEGIIKNVKGLKVPFIIESAIPKGNRDMFVEEVEFVKNNV